MGRFDESTRSFERAVALDPVSPLEVSALDGVTTFARRYEEAAAHGRRALELDPGYVVAHVWLGLALEELSAAVRAG
jgi:tetratricopeptide (TPR) repeat protein